MDASPVLRLQSQNKIRSDFMRMKNETNKLSSHPKPFRLQSAHHLSDQNIENQDPGNSQAGRKAQARPGVSRLPVLAKSLRLQTPSGFSQSHCQWEDKPLSGKAKKKRPNTRPIPFNLSQPKSSRVASENQHPPTLSQTKTGTHAVKPSNGSCNIHLKPQTSNAKSAKHTATLNSNSDSSKGTTKTDGKAPDHTHHLSTTLSQPLPAVSNKALHQSHGTTSSAQSAHSADACLDNMSLLSLKDPIKSASQNMQLTTQGNFINSSNENVENFQPDHAAFLSILRNEGVSVTGSGSTTPLSKAYNYVPQRVSVMRSRQKAGPSTGLVRSMQFSPDPAALQSILQNEGVRPGGPVGATPLNPTRPSGRNTSVYTAQRVPVRRNHVEAGPVAVALKETPLKKWTPQRVRDTRHQPMSAVKWLLSTQQSPYGGTPGLRSGKTNLQPQQEEIVQKLFNDQEDQQGMKDPDTGTNQLTVQITSDLKSKPRCEEKEETSRATKDNNDDQEENEQEQRNVGGQPFLQAPHRESVIFFSTGKQLLRVPRFEKLESSANQEQHGVISSAQTKMLPVHEEKSSTSEPTNQIIPPIQSLHRDLSCQKPCSKSPAVAMLRKRLPQLEELRLDEEVATYTSVSVQTAPGFLPPRPRCGNPLASVLHFEEYSRFVPIDCDLSSGPTSPLQEK